VAGLATIDPRGRTSITDMLRSASACGLVTASLGPLEMPEAFLRVCVLACRRRRTPSGPDDHERDH
jgi:hypothetical protein